jgi:putative oxidoreductase
MKFLIDFLINGPERLSAYFAWLPPLFARFVVGWVFLWTGWAKLNNLPQITENFASWGIPFPEIMTPFVSGVEFFGGLLLLLGLFTRIAAVPLVIVMIVAIISAKWGDVDSLETLRASGGCLHGAVRWLAVVGPAHLFDRILRTGGSSRLSPEKKRSAGKASRSGGDGVKAFRSVARQLDGVTMPGTLVGGSFTEQVKIFRTADPNSKDAPSLLAGGQVPTGGGRGRRRAGSIGRRHARRQFPFK